MATRPRAEGGGNVPCAHKHGSRGRFGGATTAQGVLPRALPPPTNRRPPIEPLRMRHTQRDVASPLRHVDPSPQCATRAARVGAGRGDTPPAAGDGPVSRLLLPASQGTAHRRATSVLLRWHEAPCLQTEAVRGSPAAPAVRQPVQTRLRPHRTSAHHGAPPRVQAARLRSALARPHRTGAAAHQGAAQSALEAPAAQHHRAQPTQCDGRLDDPGVVRRVRAGPMRPHVPKGAAERMRGGNLEQGGVRGSGRAGAHEDAELRA